MNRAKRTTIIAALLVLLMVSLMHFKLQSNAYLSMAKSSTSIFRDTLLETSNTSSSICITNDGERPFPTQHPTSIWTLAPTTVVQLQSVLVLGLSLRNVAADLVLLESSSKPLGDLERERLVQVGWKRHCQVSQIVPSRNSTSHHNSDEKHHEYVLPHLLGMIEYERIIYMAPDTLLVGGSNMDDIMHMNLTNGRIAATKEVWSADSGTFDPSVLVLRPDRDEYTRLLQLTRATQMPSVETERDFLNAAYRYQWQEMGFQYNANVSIYRYQRDFWDNYNISIIHYTGPKPLGCNDDDLTICQPWLKVYRELHANASSPCRNLDFQPVEKTALFTLNTGFPKLVQDYVHGSVMLGLSARQHSTIPFDLVHMEQLSKQIPEEHWPLLKSVGWKQCVVDRIPPPRYPTNMPQYLDQFTKLHTWHMDMYDSLVYMDSDIWVTGPLDNLLSMDLEEHRIAATRDYIIDGTRNGWVKTFNMGVFKINPNETEYDRLMQLREDDAVDYEGSLSEQGWINVVYNGTWKEMSHKYNTNMIALRNGEVAASSVSVLHGTLPKFHYSCKERRFRVAKPYCDAWKAAVKNYTLNFQALINGTTR